MHTSDIQFIARMVQRVRAGDQITSREANRLDVIAAQGHSSDADERTPDVHSGDPITVGEANRRGIRTDAGQI